MTGEKVLYAERMQPVTYIGITNWRSSNKKFGIKEIDRFGHIYCIGKTGVGKSTLLLNMAINDIDRGKGICLIDPHGDIATSILDYVPPGRINDVIYFNATDVEYPIAFNPLENVPPAEHHLAASGLVATFKKIWSDSWGPRLEYILRYTLLSLLEYPKATLLDIQPLLTDYSFRNKVLQFVTNPQVVSFWRNEFDKYPPNLRTEAINPILNKAGVLNASVPLRNIFGQSNARFTIQSVMDNGKLLICNLSKGSIGEDATTIIGSMIVTAIQLAALRRSKIAEQDRSPFFLYVDEMHSFVSLSFADILSEARKYKLGLFLTHQYIEQVQEEIRSAIFGNVGTFIAFRVGATDAIELAKEFHPVFVEDDIINLPKYSMYIKLMIDGATSKPFSAQTLPVEPYTASFKKIIIEQSREKNARKKEEVEELLFLNTEKQTFPTLFSSSYKV